MRLYATVDSVILLRAAVSAVVLSVSAPVVVATPAPTRLFATVDSAALLAAHDVSVVIPRKDAPRLYVGKIEYGVHFELKLADTTDTLDAMTIQRTLQLADLAGASDQLVKAFGKALADSQANSDALSSISVGKALSDSQGNSEALTFNVSKVLDDTQGTSDSINVQLGFNLTLVDTQNETDSLIFDVGKVLTDTVSTPSDALTVALSKPLSDTQGVTDGGPSFTLNKRIGAPAPSSPWDGAAWHEVGWNASTDDNLVWAFDLITRFDVGKAIADTAGASSQITRIDISKPLSDSQGVSDTLAKHMAPATIADTQGVNDSVAIGMGFNRAINDMFTSPWNGEAFNEGVWNGNDKGNAVWSTDLITRLDVGKVLSDSQGVSDALSIILNEFRDWNAGAWDERTYN